MHGSDAVAFELAIEGGAADAEHKGGARPVAMSGGESLVDGAALKFFDRHDARGRNARRREAGGAVHGRGQPLQFLALRGGERSLHRRGQVAGAQTRLGDQGHHALNRVLDLARVAGPVIVHHGVERFRRQFVFAAVVREEVRHQERDVLPPFAQGRQPHHYYVEAVEEIAAEAAGVHLAGEVAVGCGDDAEARLVAGERAECADLAKRGAELVLGGHAAARIPSADLVVVSSGAIESARLLLNSKSRMHPNGLGNRHDWVGRNLQGHTYVGATGVFEQDVYDDIGPGASIAICDFNHGNPGLTGGGLLANEFIRLPYQFATMTPPGVPRWGQAHKDFMRRAYRRHIAIRGPVQEMPVFDCRVQADPKVRDHWDIPVARLSGLSHANNVDVGRFLAEKAAVWLREAGATLVWKSMPSRYLSAGQHQAGTCRMGNDPKTSVVDKHCRVHDHDNLYVIDASVHVTNGGFNPALTIMAVAYHASDGIRRAWKGKAL